MQRHELYSNVFSHITTPERSIEGNYFRSDERMEHYFISNSKGSFMADDMENDNGEEKPASEPTDTTEQPAPQVRPAATRHAAGRNN